MRPPPFSSMTSNVNKNQAGFTLIELLIGMAMALVITMAAVSMFSSELQKQPEVTQAADVIGTARNAAERITADLREGEKATLAKPYELNLVTPCSAITAGASGSCPVNYNCAFRESGQTTYSCVRSAGGTTKTVITGLASREVFCVYPTATVGKECGPQGAVAPRYVGVTLELPNHAGAAANTVLEDGAALHNNLDALAGL